MAGGNRAGPHPRGIGAFLIFPSWRKASAFLGVPAMACSVCGSNHNHARIEVELAARVDFFCLVTETDAGCICTCGVKLVEHPCPTVVGHSLRIPPRNSARACGTDLGGCLEIEGIPLTSEGKHNGLEGSDTPRNRSGAEALPGMR
jgi:hypothetical protein